jgi:ELWxxDGT repeat protein
VNGDVELLKDIIPGPESGFLRPAHEDPIGSMGETLFFYANDAVNGLELWKSNGNAPGTVLVKDINPGAGTSIASPVRPMVAMNGNLYFAANDGTHGEELWKSDGTAAGTVMVKDINDTAFQAAGPMGLTSVGVPGSSLQTLFFIARDEAHGVELWKTDGTAAGTALVKDINPGFTSSLGSLTNVNGTLFFTAVAGALTHPEVWRSDGTSAGTIQLTSFATDLPELRAFTNVNGTLFFAAKNGELWRSNGTPETTVLVHDFGFTSVVGFTMREFNGLPVFMTVDHSANTSSLWTSNGIDAVTLIKTFSTFSVELLNINGTLVFDGADGVGTRGLWASDGTTAGTVLVPGSSGTNPRLLTNVDGALFFLGSEQTGGIELWRTKKRF